MSTVDSEKRLSVFSGGSFQGLTISVMTGLRELLTPGIRKVNLYGLRREYYKVLIASLRAEYEPYGAVVTVNTSPMYDSVDISWPASDSVTILVMDPSDLKLAHLQGCAHDTRVIGITAQPMTTTWLFDLYDISRQSGIHTRIYTTGYVPEPGPLSLLESFELIHYVSSAKSEPQVTADINGA